MVNEQLDLPLLYYSLPLVGTDTLLDWQGVRSNFCPSPVAKLAYHSLLFKNICGSLVFDLVSDRFRTTAVPVSRC